MNANMSGQTHDQLQAACWAEACKKYHPFVHKRLITVPNDMHAGNVVRWKQYEALGVTPGVWDMVLHWFAPAPIYEDQNRICVFPAVHWFEFKVGSDTLSAAQKKFRKTMLPLGHKFYIISEQQEFTELIKLIVEPTLHIAKEIWPDGL